ncbi:MAG: hypothetical protein K5651_05570 [Bacteroidales bacterium]|nr:hypothetical protein [Bacteroidales bacterium]
MPRWIRLKTRSSVTSTAARR